MKTWKKQEDPIIFGVIWSPDLEDLQQRKNPAQDVKTREVEVWTWTMEPGWTAGGLTGELVEQGLDSPASIISQYLDNCIINMLCRLSKIRGRILCVKSEWRQLQSICTCKYFCQLWSISTCICPLLFDVHPKTENVLSSPVTGSWCHRLYLIALLTNITVRTRNTGTRDRCQFSCGFATHCAL